VVAEYVRHLQRSAHDAGSVRRHHLHAKAVERAGGAGDDIRGDLGIDGGRRQPGMAKQHLDDADICAAFQQMGGEAVAQGVKGLSGIPCIGERVNMISPARLRN